MKHIEEKDGKVFIDGVEYIPKKYNNELPKCYADIVKKHNYTFLGLHILNLYLRLRNLLNNFLKIIKKTLNLYLNIFICGILKTKYYVFLFNS